MRRGRMRAAAAVVALGLGLGAAAIEGRRIADDAATPGTRPAAPSLAQLFAPDPHRLFGRSSLRVLVVGLDYDYDARDQETSKGSRSDILMALNLDFARRTVSELSIPRDMEATLPGGRLAKINQAQSEGGVRESEAVAARWLGVPGFDRYVVLRIDAAKDLVDAVGGVDVDVRDSDALRGRGANGPLDYDDSWGHLHVHLKPGPQRLNGEAAVGYARFRHDWCSDPCRIMRQQQVMQALVARVTRDRWNTATHVRQLVGVARKDVETDFSGPEQLAVALAFSGLAPGAIRAAQVPYVDTVMLPEYGDALVPDEAEKRRLVAALLVPDAPGLASAPLRVRVENGTVVAGLAGRVADRLRRRGFVVVDVVDAPSSDFAVTQIRTTSPDAAASRRLREALGATTTVAASATSGTGGASAAGATDAAGAADTEGGAGGADATVVLGRDIVGAP